MAVAAMQGANQHIRSSLAQEHFNMQARWATTNSHRIQLMIATGQKQTGCKSLAIKQAIEDVITLDLTKSHPRCLHRFYQAISPGEH